MNRLPDHNWKARYSHEDGDLVYLFYVPALRCAVRYDRLTGYFSADALALAARGVEGLIHNGGHMRLVVGCTLDEAEREAIQTGYDLRKLVEQKLAQIPLDPPDDLAASALGSLQWLVAAGRLEVKVALPCDVEGVPVIDIGVYHEKAGILADAEGNRLAFNGSINETLGGWINNRESFHIYKSWDASVEHVEEEERAFARLWAGKSKSVLVLPFPQSRLGRMTEELPRRHDLPPLPNGPKEHGEPAVEVRPAGLSREERRRQIWAFLRAAPRLPGGGERVGEVTAAINPWPHQHRAFQRLYRNWPPRLLIADEVGLGKTIQAGLLIRQAWLAQRARRILIMVPKAVLRQWQVELREKFNLNWPIYDGRRLVWLQTHGWQGPIEREVSRSEWHMEPCVLVSSHLMRRKDRSVELLGAEPWDLVVLDEAHHARRKAPGTPMEGGPNALLRLMKALSPRTSGLVLMTATPMQVHPVEIWDLLHLLGLPEGWTADRFVHYFERLGRNPSVGELHELVRMFQEAEAYHGPVTESEAATVMSSLTPISQRKVLRALREDSSIPLKQMSVNERQGATRVLESFSPIKRLMSRHTRDLLRLYHAKGLLDTPIPHREVTDDAVVLTPKERDLYEAVENYISTTYNNAAPERRTSVGFVMTIYRRRLASSFAALRRTLERHYHLIEQGEPPDTDEIVEDLSPDETRDEVMDESEAVSLEAEALRNEEKASIQELLRRIALTGTDSKALKLLQHLEFAKDDGFDSALIFTQYEATMDFLKDFLADRQPLFVACYSGSGGQYRERSGTWVKTTREEIKRAFMRGEVRILLCTDAGAEGLNFQFCGCVINYDLPWNPMKVEQRIGRIDRIGQRYPKIRIINLTYEDTVEADVYSALGQRIGLFHRMVGKLQPILSQVPRAFEHVALLPREEQVRVRRSLISDLERQAREMEQHGFDLDAATAAEVSAPALPDPPYTMADLDQLMRRPELLPPGTAVRPLDPRSYAYQWPGVEHELRVTTSPDMYEDNSDSLELWSPGAPVFPAQGLPSAEEDSSVKVSRLQELLDS